MIKFYDVEVLDITDEQYFKDYKDYLSNTRLSLINESEGGSDAVFVNPTPVDDEYRAFKIGGAIHNLFLQPETFTLSDFEVPTAAIVRIFNSVYKLVKRVDGPLEFEEALSISIKLHNYYGGDPGEKRLNNLLEKGMPYYNYLCEELKLNEILLSTTDKNLVLGVLSVLKADKTITEILIPDELFNQKSYNEQALICKVDNDGKIYNFKVKIDNWIYDPVKKVVTLNDLKTTAFNLDNFLGIGDVLKPKYEGYFDLATQFHPGSFQKYHYYRQFALYEQVLKAYLMENKLIDDTWVIERNVIVVQTTYEPRAKVYEVVDFWIEKGLQEAEYLFNKLNKIDNLVFLDQDYNFDDF